MSNIGEDLFRYKGIVSLVGQERRFVFQGVHMLMNTTYSSLWPGSRVEYATCVSIDTVYDDISSTINQGNNLPIHAQPGYIVRFR